MYYVPLEVTIRIMSEHHAEVLIDENTLNPVIGNILLKNFHEDESRGGDQTVAELYADPVTRICVQGLLANYTKMVDDGIDSERALNYAFGGYAKTDTQGDFLRRDTEVAALSPEPTGSGKK